MMAKQEQVLQIDPAQELHFRGPFTEVVSSKINLHNPTDSKVCFKVKTTAPKKYCVRPNSGVVFPRATVAVSVMLQPHDFNISEKSKHKFMVQSIIAEDNVENLDNIWKEAPSDKIMDSKLKCVFDLPDEHVSEIDLPEKSGEVKEISTSSEATTVLSSISQINVPQIKEDDSEKTSTQPIVGEENMQAEILRLKGENETLKDEVRQRIGGIKTSPGPPPEVMQALQAAESENQFPPIVYLIVALVLGIIIGKFLL